MSYFFCPPEDKDVHVMFAVSQGIKLTNNRLEWNMRTNLMDVNGIPFSWVEPDQLPVFEDGNSTTYTILLKQMPDSHVVRAEFPSVKGTGRVGFFAPTCLYTEWKTYYEIHTVVEDA